MHLMKLISSVSQVHIEFRVFLSTNKLNGISVFKTTSRKKSSLLIMVIVAAIV